MPVISNQAVTQTLEEVLVRYGGGITVVIKTTVADVPPSLKSHDITREEALPFWGAHATEGLNRWEDLCGILYQILINRGDLQGIVA